MRTYVWRTPRKTCILKIGVEYNSRASHARRLFPAFLDHTIQTFRSNTAHIARVRKKYDCFAVYGWLSDACC